MNVPDSNAVINNIVVPSESSSQELKANKSIDGAQSCEGKDADVSKETLSSLPLTTTKDVSSNQTKEKNHEPATRIADDDSESKNKGKSKSDDKEKVTTPSQMDVLCGRGSHITRHPGNIIFRSIARHNKELYNVCEKEEKYKLAESIVLAIEEQDGRFLESSTPNSNMKQVEGGDGNGGDVIWSVIPNERAIRKTLQALRETPNSEKKKRKNSIHKHTDEEMPPHLLNVWQKLIRHVLPHPSSSSGDEDDGSATPTLTSDGEVTPNLADSPVLQRNGPNKAVVAAAAKQIEEAPIDDAEKISKKEKETASSSLPKSPKHDRSRLQNLIDATEEAKSPCSLSPKADRSLSPKADRMLQQGAIKNLKKSPLKSILKSPSTTQNKRQQQSSTTTTMDHFAGLKSNIPVQKKVNNAKACSPPIYPTAFRNSPPNNQNHHFAASLLAQHNHPYATVVGQQQQYFQNTNRKILKPSSYPTPITPEHRSDRSRLQMLVDRARQNKKRKAAAAAAAAAADGGGTSGSRSESPLVQDGSHYTTTATPPTMGPPTPPQKKQVMTSSAQPGNNISQLQMLVNRVRKRKLGGIDDATLAAMTEAANNHQYGNRVVPFKKKDSSTKPTSNQIITDNILLGRSSNNKKARNDISYQPDVHQVMIGDIFEEKQIRPNQQQLLQRQQQQQQQQQRDHHDDSEEGYSSTVTDEERSNGSTKAQDDSYQQAQEDYWENFFQSSSTSAAAV